jgi:hypothetical protein
MAEENPDISIRGPFFSGKKKLDFKTSCLKINQKIPRRNSNRKLQDMHGKKKNDKDEIINILLKHVFTSLTLLQ